MKVLTLFCVAVLLILAGCGDDSSNIVTPPTPSVPTITSITPNSVSRGQKDFTVSVNGTNLNGATSVTLGGGIVVDGFQVVSSTRIDVQITVIPGAIPGSRPVAVVTPAGTAVSNNVLSISSNFAPVPSFTLDPPAGNISTKVKITFDASSTHDENGGPLQFRWAFGDGTTANGQKPTHQFSRPGSFTITLTAEDNQNASNVASLDLDVSTNAAPVPVISVTPQNGNEGDEIQFDGTASYDPDGRVVQYLWNFHDGKPNSTGKIVVKTFKAGTYNVTLTVTDNRGISDVASKEVKVEEVKEIQCEKDINDHGLIYGTVIAVEPNHNAIVQFDNHNFKCQNVFYECGDMRDGESDLDFFGIVKSMGDRGNGIFRIENACPFKWPPFVGQRIFLIHKSCQNNFCP